MSNTYPTPLARDWIIIHDYSKPNPLNDIFLRFGLLKNEEQQWLNLYYPPGKDWEYSKDILDNPSNRQILDSISQKLRFFPKIYIDISKQTFKFNPKPYDV